MKLPEKMAYQIGYKCRVSIVDVFDLVKSVSSIGIIVEDAEGKTVLHETFRLQEEVETFIHDYKKGE